MAKTRAEIRVFVKSVPPQGSFDWAVEFVEVFVDEAGQVSGFDAVLANPPYGATLSADLKTHITKNFRSYRYRFETYVYFIERGLQLLTDGGSLVYITPELWLKLESAEPMRRIIFAEASFSRIRMLGEGVFPKAVVSTIVFVLQKGRITERILIEAGPEAFWLQYSEWSAAPVLAIDHRVSPSHRPLMSKMRPPHTVPLSTFGDAIQGITPYDRYRGQSVDVIAKRAFHASRMRDDTYGKWLAGGDVTRYSLQWSGEWLSYGPWLAAQREARFFSGERILFREIPGPGRRVQACLVEEETYYHGHSITPFKLHLDSANSAYFLLAVANSQIMSWYCGNELPNFGKDTFPKLNPIDVKGLPIPNASESDKQTLEDFVRRIIAAKRLDPKSDLADVEAEIDRRVEFLYFHADEAPTYDEWVAKREAEKGTAIEGIRNLIAAGESGAVEFKQSLEYVDPAGFVNLPEAQRGQRIAESQKAVVHTALKTICAFMNTRSGTLLLGVHDNGSIIGIEPDYTLLGRKQDRDGFENKLTDLLKTRVRPIPHNLEISFVEVDGKTVCRIDAAAERTPHYLDNKLYVRLGNSTEELTGRDLEDWLAGRRAEG